MERTEIIPKPYGDANADAITLASVKLKETFKENVSYWDDEEQENIGEE